MMQVALVVNKRFGTDGISMFVLKNYHYFRHEEVKYHLIYPERRGDDSCVESYLSEFTRNGDRTTFISKEEGICHYIRHFVRYLRQNKIDIIHIHGSSSAVLLEAILAKWGGQKM